MPWRYVYEMAKRLPEHGWTTAILTNKHKRDGDGLVDVTVVKCSYLSPFAKRSILKVIENISPDIILWPLGPKSIAYRSLLKEVKAKIIGYIPGPILTKADFYTTCRARLPGEAMMTAWWMLARLLGWGKVMASCCEEFVVISEANRGELIKMGIDEKRVHLITAGRDSLADHPSIEDVDRSPERPGVYPAGRKVALYIGWPKRVRGIEALLNAFAIAARQNKNLQLKILARGKGTSDHARLQRLVGKHPARERITIVEGFLSKEDVSRHISECDFGILPFIQVPADRPLSFLEFFAKGKPVISTDTSGIPELISNKRGIVARRDNLDDMAKSLLRMASMTASAFSEYQKACINFAKGYPTWKEVSSQFVDMVKEI